MRGSKETEAPRFIDVMVEGAGDCDDVCLRYKAIGETRVARRVRWAPESGEGARLGPVWYRALGRAEDGSRGVAHAVLVEDSSAGVAMLVLGGGHGLWLTRDDAAADARGYAESYLLLAREAVELAD